MLTTGNIYCIQDVLVKLLQTHLLIPGKKTTQTKEKKGFRSKLAVNE